MPTIPNCQQIRLETTLVLSVLLTLITGSAAIAAGLFVADRIVASTEAGADLWHYFDHIALAWIAGAFLYANLAYQLTRVGQAFRYRHRPDEQDARSGIFASDRPKAPLAVLVPSYNENIRLLHQTLMSVALQPYPHSRVVLLIDDPPYPNIDGDLRDLLTARRLPKEIEELLSAEAVWIGLTHKEFRARINCGSVDLQRERDQLAATLQKAALWFLHQAANYTISDHTDQLFVRCVWLEPGEELLARGESVRDALTNDDDWDIVAIDREYRRILAIFNTKLTSFERKRLVNLSQERNKAANINSYIALIGKSFCHIAQNDGVALVEASSEHGDWAVPDATYIMVVDADSVILSDYANALISELETPGNERVAITQTPYVAVPNPQRLLERIAGATTDVQHIVHQGYTAYASTFWVGANAVARKAALDDICTIEYERGYAIPKYIQDRTHIEDTESSIDLVERGWTLYNYPARLAYSATPPDFGSFLIQRRRWANGGLIIAPKVLRILASRSPRTSRLLQVWIRLSYLIGLALGSVAMLASLIYPFDDARLGIVLTLAGITYVTAYIWDLQRQGYSFKDFFHVYSLNLLLIPINLAGVIKSLYQAISGRKTPFERTPKIDGRTAVPRSFILLEYAILGLCLTALLTAIVDHRWVQAIWTSANSIAMINGLLHLVLERGREEAPA